MAAPRRGSTPSCSRRRRCGFRRLDVYLQFDRPLEEDQLTAIRELVRRRGEGEPVAHLTGEREFYGRPFTVSRDVLIPRPETETLVALTLERIGAADGVRVADIGTGSGCVAVSVAAERANATVTATDLSEAALLVAEANVRRHRLSDRVELISGSWCAPFAGREFDVVVSNPPYVPSAEIDGLARDVRDHEPVLALDGGADGLDAYRSLLPSMATVLAPADGPRWRSTSAPARSSRRSATMRSARVRAAPCTTISPDARAW